jgi:hypothetical protein
MLGNSVALNVEVVGLLDSPLWLDMPPYNPKAFAGFGADCQGVYGFANVQHLGKGCMALHTGANAWKCVMGEYRMPHVKTPYIIVASQYDSFQLGVNGIAPRNELTDAQKAYADHFAMRTSSLMQSLRSSWSKAALHQNAVLSWACYDHASSLTHRGFDQETCSPSWRTPLTLDSALMAFLRMTSERAALHRYSWIDACKGFACGKGCVSSSLACEMQESCAIELPPTFLPGPVVYP